MKLNLVEKNNKVVNLIWKTRDINCDGKELQIAHMSLGACVGLEILSDYSIIDNKVSWVNDTSKEQQTTNDEFVVIALMRGGEFFARGIHSTLNQANLILSDSIEDLDLNYLKGKKIILADSVINNGTSMLEYIKCIDNVCDDYIITTIVIQDQAIKLFDEGKLFVVRSSRNKYKGVGVIDTGNRLLKTYDND